MQLPLTIGVGYRALLETVTLSAHSELSRLDRRVVKARLERVISTELQAMLLEVPDELHVDEPR